MESNYQTLINLLVTIYNQNADQIQSEVEELSENELEEAIAWINNAQAYLKGSNVFPGSVPGSIVQWVTPPIPKETLLSFLQADIGYGTF